MPLLIAHGPQTANFKVPNLSDYLGGGGGGPLDEIAKTEAPCYSKGGTIKICLSLHNGYQYRANFEA